MKVIAQNTETTITFSRAEIHLLGRLLESGECAEAAYKRFQGALDVRKDLVNLYRHQAGLAVDED